MIWYKVVNVTVFILSFRSIIYPSDFTRRAREYDPASYKSIEWQQLSMYAFPILIGCLGAEKSNEKSVLLSFAFLSRAMRLPEEEYQKIPAEMIDRASNILLECHEKAFGPTAGTYNYHIVGCHLPFIREQLGSFSKISAYCFESSYGDMRRNFMPGTRKK